MLDIEERSGITMLRLRHGRVNALDLALLRAITAAMRDLSPSTAAVITGTGTTFSAGVDLRQIVAGGPPYVREFLPALSQAFMAVFDHDGPVVAAINGHAIAGGCVLAAAADLRLMSQGTIGLTELRVGVPFPQAALEIMRHAVGPAADRLVLTGELLDAPRAQAIGLVHEITPSAHLIESAVEQAAAMARIPAEAFAFSKHQLHRPVLDKIASGVANDEETLVAWSAARTLDGIAQYLDDLRRRRTQR